MYDATTIGEPDCRTQPAVKQPLPPSDAQQNDSPPAGAPEIRPDDTLRITPGRLCVIAEAENGPSTVPIKFGPIEPAPFLTTAVTGTETALDMDSVHKISREQIESLGNVSGVCSLTAFDGLDRKA
jgi:hypothetical protein